MILLNGDRRGRDRIVVGFTTTCVISAYHYLVIKLLHHYIIIWFPAPLNVPFFDSRHNRMLYMAFGCCPNNVSTNNHTNI